ncbi:putative receptor-like protein kinase SRF [Septoria linicola]|nr:putative receptor-like protein kinase SRF [Septoria linicola]
MTSSQGTTFSSAGDISQFATGSVHLKTSSASPTSSSDGLDFIDVPRAVGGEVMDAQAESGVQVLAGGTTGLIKLHPNNSLVEKAPYPDSKDVHLSIRDLRREYAAYQRLPQHPRLLHLHSDSTPEKLVLPYLQNGCLHEFLRGPPVSSVRRLAFAADAAEGLHILHCAGIIHGDINSWNFLVDDDCRLRIIDFAGSTIDDQPGSAFEGFRYCLPRSIDDPSTVQTDLFALGSLLYEIVTSEKPYKQYKDEEVEELFKQGHFPSTEGILLRRAMLSY